MSKKAKKAPTHKRSMRRASESDAGDMGINISSGGRTKEDVRDLAGNVSISFYGDDRKSVKKQTARGKSVPDESLTFQDKGALDPPFEPTDLINIYESSASLSPNITSYVVNIDAFGHRFDPAVDFESEASIKVVRDALIFDRMFKAGENGDKSFTIPKISDEEIKKKIELLKVRQRFERFRLDSFFNAVHPTLSFIQIRKRTRFDLEITGNAYWELLRNRKGELSQINPLAVVTVRLLNVDPEWVDVTQWVKTTPITFEKRTIKRRFRKYIQLQVQGDEAVYFKELGDTRLMSSGSGKFYKDVKEMEEAEPGAKAATELLHFRIYSARSAYGVPRWVGVMISVLGARHAEEVNFLYFENKSVPPLALLVSGGKIGPKSVDRIQDFIRNEIRGKRNFHKILVIEAEGKNPMAGMNSPSTIRIELKPLTDAQQSDALFQKYDERNGEKVGAAFRVPPILRGETKDFNRATAEAAKILAEEQTFEPERDDFDSIINRQFMIPELHSALWIFRSLAPITRDPEKLAKVVESLSKANGLVPADVRKIAEEILNVQLPEILLGWTKQPMALTLAGMAPGAVPGVTADGDAALGPPPPTGSMGSANSAVEGETQKQGDLSIQDLATQGGLKVPAQGLPKEEAERQLKELRERLEALGFVFDDLPSLLKFAQALKLLQNVVNKDKGRGDPDDDFAIEKGTKPEEVITIKVGPGTFDDWGITADAKESDEIPDIELETDDDGKEDDPDSGNGEG